MTQKTFFALIAKNAVFVISKQFSPETPETAFFSAAVHLKIT